MARDSRQDQSDQKNECNPMIMSKILIYQNPYWNALVTEKGTVCAIVSGGGSAALLASSLI